MKLRTRLFFSFTSLITVALLGLALALISVMQMARTQEQLIDHNFLIIEINQKLRLNLGNHLAALFEDPIDQKALLDAQTGFQQTLERALEVMPPGPDQDAFRSTRERYEGYLLSVASPQAVYSLKSESHFGVAFRSLRDHLLQTQQESLNTIRSENQESRERAILVASMLGMVGLAVLLIGFVTANGLARRFGTPIEGLAAAADRIGRGDFDITLPVTPVAEMSALSRRFGLMAESLRQFRSTDVEALAAGQRRLQAVLDSIDDGLLILDRQGRLEHLNPVALRQLGWDGRNIGMTLGQALQNPELDRQLQLILEGGYLEQAPEDLAVETQGETRLLTYSLTPVSHAEGYIIGAVMVLRDVTEQRAFDRLRSEFVLRASHELRTPVTGMHMAFGLLRERLVFPPESREVDLMHTVEEEMQRLVRLINDLLNFSRYQNGMQTLDRSPCDLPELLEEIEQRFGEQAAEQEVVLECEAQTPLPRLQLDRVQIVRVLDNLVDNALRHSKPGGRIRLQARRHGERVILSVEDNGEGIAFGQQARIFEPFVQVGRKKGGAGLGLALCKEIVQLHGGRIGVYSRPGQGTQFYFALPL